MDRLVDWVEIVVVWVVSVLGVHAIFGVRKDSSGYLVAALYLLWNCFPCRARAEKKEKAAETAWSKERRRKTKARSRASRRAQRATVDVVVCQLSAADCS